MLGFALGEHHDMELANGALVMAVAVRGGQLPGVISHTDSKYGRPVVPGVLTRTAADARGCWCQAAPGLPDPHFRLTAVLSCPGYVGCPAALGEAPRLADGVT
ncbi:MAG TPA: hypothetical protein VF070_03530 [Streptosporangiaceae bacterium]